jgi:RNA 2',3'-cyclic 3'-phosphodiesterase
MTTPTPQGLRSFVAVPLPGALQAELAAAAAALASELPNVKWSQKPENFHVTLKFLGPVAVERLDALAADVRDAVAEIPPFAFTVRGLGAFPSAEAANVVYAAVEDVAGALAAVAEVVEMGAGRFGFVREARQFTGHVTIGRSKLGIDAREALMPWNDHAFGVVAVDEVHVYESRLAQQGEVGSTYVLRGRLPLGARAAN